MHKGQCQEVYNGPLTPPVYLFVSAHTNKENDLIYTELERGIAAAIEKGSAEVNTNITLFLSSGSHIVRPLTIDEKKFPAYNTKEFGTFSL